ncbi:MAG: sulfotransferase [Planctomycetota bacterium]|jgi:hypothetical protein
MAYFFVGGAARTGTTLVQHLLCCDGTANPLIGEAAPVRQILLCHQRTRVHWQNFPGHYFGKTEDLDRFYHDVLKRFLQELKTQYACENLVLKEPELTKYFPVLWEILGRHAKFICLVRDPRAAIASMVVWGQKARKRGATHFFQERDMKKLSDFFKAYYEPLDRCTSDEFRRRLMYLRYEDLVQVPLKAVSELSVFAGMELVESDPAESWDKCRIDFARAGAPLQDTVTGLYGKPVSAEKVAAYREVLREEEVRVVEKHCAGFMNRYGYEVSSKAKEHV